MIAGLCVFFRSGYRKASTRGHAGRQAPHAVALRSWHSCLPSLPPIRPGAALYSFRIAAVRNWHSSCGEGGVNGSDQLIAAAIRWAHQWQRLSSAAMNHAIGHYLRGCANVAMARTPHQALAALHELQTILLSHSADTFAEATRLLREQNIGTEYVDLGERPEQQLLSKSAREDIVVGHPQ